MLPPIDYLQVLLIIVFAVLTLLAIFFFRERWNTPPTRLRTVLAEEPFQLKPSDADLLAPLLLYEEDYPAFADILGLALSRFPLERLQRISNFLGSLQFLSSSAGQEQSPEQVQAAMCQVIRALLEDPDVEYGCRPDLQELIDQFLNQLEQIRAAGQKRRSEALERRT